MGEIWELPGVCGEPIKKKLKKVFHLTPTQKNTRKKLTGWLPIFPHNIE
jgi:hypothetical protein